MLVPQIVGSTYLTVLLMCIGCLMIRVLYICVAVYMSRGACFLVGRWVLLFSYLPCYETL